jgi:hypothetical protein
MVHITKVRKNNKALEETQWNFFLKNLQDELRKQGFSFYTEVVSPYNSFKISDVRLSEEWTKKHGYNVSPYTGKRGSILGWKDWVRFNNTLNNVMNRHRISANAQSLGGKFTIRKGGVPMTESDWEALAEENVGSMVRPVPRREAWISEKEVGGEKELKEFRKRLREW